MITFDAASHTYRRAADGARVPSVTEILRATGISRDFDALAAFGDKTRDAIDEEIRRLIDDNYERARNILTSHLEKLHVMADALMRYETIDEQQIHDIMEGRKPRAPQGWEDLGPPTAGAATGEKPVAGPGVGEPAAGPT